MRQKKMKLYYRDSRMADVITYDKLEVANNALVFYRRHPEDGGYDIIRVAPMDTILSAVKYNML